MATDIEIDGLEDLESRLLELEGKVVNRVVRKALREAGKIVVTAAKSKAPKDSGALRESITTIARKGKGKNLQTMFVGSKAKHTKALALANAKRSRKIKGIFYGHMVEKGTVQRSNKGGANRGAIGPQPFLRPALDENASEIVTEFSDELKKAIDSVTRKAAS